jgi:hypothetical protein
MVIILNSKIMSRNDDEYGQGFLLFFFITMGIIITALVFVWKPGDRISIIQADFGESSLQPGGSTLLTIRIKNTSGETDVHNVSVAVIPSDLAAVQVENGGQVIVDILGAGEERVIKFSIAIAQNSLPGKYKIKVSTSTGDTIQGDTRDCYIDIIST